MDPILLSVYGAVLPAAPYVIAAYALIWVILFVYVAVIARGLRRNARDIELLEEEVARVSSRARLGNGSPERD